MKKVFFLGDSIRLHYQELVQEQLKDRAQFFWSPDNGRFTSYTMRYLDQWAALCPDADIVHWNNGHWDADHMYGDEDSLVSFDEYKRNLSHLEGYIRKLFPKARIIFAFTTPVDDGHPRVFNSEIERNNEAARAILEPRGVIINDLYSVIKSNMQYIGPDKTHMLDEGCQALAKQVSRTIEALL